MVQAGGGLERKAAPGAGDDETRHLLWGREGRRAQSSTADLGTPIAPPIGSRVGDVVDDDGDLLLPRLGPGNLEEWNDSAVIDAAALKMVSISARPAPWEMPASAEVIRAAGSV